MKKLLSILLLALLVFNMLGFSVYSLVESENNSFCKENSELIVKLPFSLPYVTEWNNTENLVDQELLHDDDYYKILSQKIANDTLYVQCKFSESARDRFWDLISVFDQNIKTSNDFNKSHPGSMIKNLLKEYMSTDKKITFFIVEWINKEVNLAFCTSSPFTVPNIPATPPPNLAC